MISVPWWMSWKKACWPLVPGSPQTTGPVAVLTGEPSSWTLLAVALHLQLLEIGGKAREPLVVGDHRLRRVAEDVAVPDAEQPHQHRDVALDRRRAEMLVDLVGAAQEFVKRSGPIAIASGRPMLDQTE